MLLATWITDQLVFDSVVTGLSSALVALGIVLTYRSTRVINFAVGNMGLPAAVVMGLLCINYGVGFWPAFAISLFVGAAFVVVLIFMVTLSATPATQSLLVGSSAIFTAVLILLVVSLSRPYSGGGGSVTPRLIEQTTTFMESSAPQVAAQSCPAASAD